MEAMQTIKELKKSAKTLNSISLNVTPAQNISLTLAPPSTPPVANTDWDANLYLGQSQVRTNKPSIPSESSFSALTFSSPSSPMKSAIIMDQIEGLKTLIDELKDMLTNASSKVSNVVTRLSKVELVQQQQQQQWQLFETEKQQQLQQWQQWQHQRQQHQRQNFMVHDTTFTQHLHPVGAMVRRVRRKTIESVKTQASSKMGYHTLTGF